MFIALSCIFGLFLVILFKLTEEHKILAQPSLLVGPVQESRLHPSVQLYYYTLFQRSRLIAGRIFLVFFPYFYRIF